VQNTFVPEVSNKMSMKFAPIGTQGLLNSQTRLVSNRVVFSWKGEREKNYFRFQTECNSTGGLTFQHTKDLFMFEPPHTVSIGQLPTSNVRSVARGQFHLRSTSSFCTCRSQKRKKRLTTWLSFLHFLDLRAEKLLVECWWYWPQ